MKVPGTITDRLRNISSTKPMLTFELYTYDTQKYLIQHRGIEHTLLPKNSDFS